MISGIGSAPREFIDAARAKLGLDKPLYVQFLIYLNDIFHGDLGYSWNYNKPVINIIFARLINTLTLTLGGFFIALLFGVFTGILAAKKPHSIVDSLISLFTLVIWSTPYSWMGLMFLLLFGLYLGWFPISGVPTPGLKGLDYVLNYLWHLFLPAACYGLGTMALYTRLMRTSMLEILHQDYILTAWSKGCSERLVYYKHAFRNALLPIVTYIGLTVKNLFTGSVIIETVFSWQGIGMLLYEAIFARDYAMVQGIFIIISFFTIGGNLMADVIYAFLDPRIRYEE
jgi:peptide/nickel transport system permease protein